VEVATVTERAAGTQAAVLNASGYVTTVTNGLTDQPLTVYNWDNIETAQTTPILTNVDGFVYRDPSGAALGTAVGERKYKGLMVVLDKRFSDRWQMNASATLQTNPGYRPLGSFTNPTGIEFTNGISSGLTC